MKYKLLKDLPMAKAGTIVFLEQENEGLFYIKEEGECAVGYILKKDIYEWLEPIVEKKTYDDLKGNDDIFEIDYTGDVVEELFTTDNARSQTFLTREEAEDEHKRREWAVRPDKFIPKEGEAYYLPGDDGSPSCTGNYLGPCDYLIINLGLAFRTPKECEKAIKENDLIRLFYTIR